jgi:AcrR family transcriptional regulator
LDAAKKMFVRKGYYGATMQEIADLAKINKAMLHYYFKNKELLYQRVFIDLFKEHFKGMYDDFKKDQPIREKLKNYVYGLITRMAKNPDEVSFVIHEYNRDPDRFINIVNENVETTPMDLISILEEEKEKGNVPEMDFKLVEMHIVALAAYPVMTKSIYQRLFDFKNEKEYLNFVIDRKEFVYEQILMCLGLD